MSKYSFEKGGYFLFKYNYKLGNVKNNGALTNSTILKRFNFLYTPLTKKYSSDATKIIFVNSNNFNFLKIRESEAERLSNNLQKDFLGNFVYYSFEFKILPIKVISKRSKKVISLMAYVNKVTFYSDKGLTTPIRTIDVSDGYSNYSKYTSVIVSSNYTGNDVYEFK